VRQTKTPSRRSRMARRARPSSIDSGAACHARTVSSSTSRATTLTARRWLPRHLTPLRARGSGPRRRDVLTLQEEEEERQAPP
jgi:hypothetical protein